ncbi:2,3,4,5-tetrahydropyridine-2,6-dicarboxylate N-succinyltransferase [bacterium]|nr:MAG: 2,3,4,5-tetrahydropyridine-2,6-dicarboxylate N-succinyltransferase [bacterium]
MERNALEHAVAQLATDNAAVRGAAGSVVDEIVDLLDRGELRVCEPGPDGWVTHAWVKQAILLYFARHESRELYDPQTELTFFDKVPTKRNYAALGVRCVPPGVARYGSFLARGCILMPGFVNIGAYVDERTMVDTWATVGSCAQIGKGVHLSGGVGIGGVLEPAQAQPVIVEDGCFIGSRSIVVEGVVVEREAVLGANVVLTASTPIVDVTGAQPVITRGRIPARSVVIPGTMPKRFAAGEFQVPCALIIGQRQESTDRKTSLNAALRDFGVSA